MIYLSEITGKQYNSAEDCLRAEKEFKEAQAREKAAKEQKAKERKVRADEVSKAYDEVRAATKRYNVLLQDFIKDYGSYHTSLKSTDDSPNLLDILFKWWD